MYFMVYYVCYATRCILLTTRYKSTPPHMNFIWWRETTHPDRSSLSLGASSQRLPHEMELRHSLQAEPRWMSFACRAFEWGIYYGSYSALYFAPFFSSPKRDFRGDDEPVYWPVCLTGGKDPPQLPFLLLLMIWHHYWSRHGRLWREEEERTGLRRSMKWCTSWAIRVASIILRSNNFRKEDELEVIFRTELERNPYPVAEQDDHPFSKSGDGWRAGYSSNDDSGKKVLLRNMRPYRSLESST